MNRAPIGTKEIYKSLCWFKNSYKQKCWVKRMLVNNVPMGGWCHELAVCRPQWEPWEVWEAWEGHRPWEGGRAIAETTPAAQPTAARNCCFSSPDDQQRRYTHPPCCKFDPGVVLRTVSCCLLTSPVRDTHNVRRTSNLT